MAELPPPLGVPETYSSVERPTYPIPIPEEYLPFPTPINKQIAFLPLKVKLEKTPSGDLGFYAQIDRIRCFFVINYSIKHSTVDEIVLKHLSCQCKVKFPNIFNQWTIRPFIISDTFVFVENFAISNTQALTQSKNWTPDLAHFNLGLNFLQKYNSCIDFKDQVIIFKKAQDFNLSNISLHTCPKLF